MFHVDVLRINPLYYFNNVPSRIFCSQKKAGIKQLTINRKFKQLLIVSFKVLLMVL